MRMARKKLKIKNRKNQTVVVLVESPKKSRGLAFVMHGLGGIKEGKHIQVFAESFLESGFTTVRFDTTNSIGESGGRMEDATFTRYYQDLEDVISWSKKQKWYKEPFCLAGHSFGGGCSLLYAQKYPKKIKALALISTFISKKLSFENFSKQELKDWEKKGYIILKSKSKPGILKKYSWKLMEDALKYDLLKNAHKLTMPTLLIIGSKDDGIPVKFQRILYKKLPSPKELHVIKGAPHTFTEEVHLKQIKKIFKDWIKKLL